jgi:tetratricopeptide (TPR) repeat protein
MKTKKCLLAFGLSIQAVIPSVTLATNVNTNEKQMTALLAQFGVPLSNSQRQQQEFYQQQIRSQGSRRNQEQLWEAIEDSKRKNEIARVERIKQARESARESIPRLESTRDYLALGQAWRTLEEWDKGLAAAEKAVEAQPNVVAGYTLRASLRKRLNNIAGAIADFDRVIEIEPDFYGYYKLRGTLKKSFDKSGAIQDFRIAMKMIRVDNRFNLIRDERLKEMAKDLESLGATE